MCHSPPFPSLAANYSMPVVSAPSSGPQGEELTITCTSTDGYPWPNVYWINRTDNSLLDKALQNSTVSRNARGLYDVVSVLRIRWAPHVNIDCCIENVLLLQNLTVSSQAETGKAAAPTQGCGPGVTWQSLSGRRQSLQGDLSAASEWWLEGRGEDSPVCDDDITASVGQAGGWVLSTPRDLTFTHGVSLVAHFTHKGLRL